MGYDIVMFDADGTLFDFGRAQEAAFYDAFARKGFRIGPGVLGVYESINRELWAKLERGEVTRQELLQARFRELFDRFGIDLDPAQFNRSYMESLSCAGFLIDGAFELLEALEGRVRMIMVTNGSRKTQRGRVKQAGIERFFSDLIISEEIGFDKPDLRFFEKALAAAGGIPKGRVLVVGDSVSADITGANNAGIPCCWYNPGGLPAPENLIIDHQIRAHRELIPIVLT